MEPWGFEPQIQPCHGRVIPFHYGPGIGGKHFIRRRCSVKVDRGSGRLRLRAPTTFEGPRPLVREAASGGQSDDQAYFTGSFNWYVRGLQWDRDERQIIRQLAVATERGQGSNRCIDDRLRVHEATVEAVAEAGVAVALR